jgi:L-lactate utilization protein LutC
MSISSQDDMFKILSQYLGLSEEEYEGEAGLLDFLAPVPVEADLKKELRNEYKDVLSSLQEQSKGYSESVKESMSSQKRQELVEAARRAGGGQRMLQGKSKGAALVQAKSQQAGAQAGVVQNVAEQEKQLKEGAKTQLSAIETSIAKSAQAQMDMAKQQRLKTGMSLFQLGELARRKNVEDFLA